MSTSVACLILASVIFAAAPCSAVTLSAGGMVGVPIMVEPEALFHTLAADFFPQRDGTIYVQTGDIPAMWLRDSAAQTLPYIRLARDRPQLRAWIRAVVARDARGIEIDPYANAFRANYRVWERKWEVDSLAYPIILAWAYDDAFHDRRLFTASLHHALERVVETYDCERRHRTCSRYRVPPHSGPADRGAAPQIGFIWSAFRASDDPTQLAYNVPEQMFAATCLRDIAQLARDFHDFRLAARAAVLADQISTAIARHGVVNDSRCGGPIYAYEVDGQGRSVVIDDANLPSLLAAPLTGFVSVDEPIYKRTRSCALSTRNRFYFRGRLAAGVGSPHTPSGYIWPLAIISRALTSVDRREILEQLQYLADSAGAGSRIHESFDPNDPTHFTRAEFGWANAMYAELLFRAAADLPAQRIVDAGGPPSRALLPASIAVVDPMTALLNRGALLTAFDRAVPFATTSDAFTGGAPSRTSQARLAHRTAAVRRRRGRCKPGVHRPAPGVCTAPRGS